MRACSTPARYELLHYTSNSHSGIENELRRLKLNHIRMTATLINVERFLIDSQEQMSLPLLLEGP
ncbi:hypothetical protein E2C01_034909 [Portunus trituberculatus]|uniref:Uncharacterized protein n=1 Tax=Portunus trituberculatus TaxID=210409 RepID=A0A5B7F7W0_PORTR|nr:hypothetical protein [Portunus trituberculatus]